MREASKDIIRLEHIIQAIERIKRYTLGKRFDDLVKDDMMYYAVVKNIVSGRRLKFFSLFLCPFEFNLYICSDKSLMR